MLPVRKRLEAIEPWPDRGMIFADVEAELFDRIVEVSTQGQVSDGRARSKQERRLFQPLVEDGEVAVDAALEKTEHGLVRRRFGPILQEAVGPEITVDLLVVEDDPAHGFELFLFALR